MKAQKLAKVCVRMCAAAGISALILTGCQNTAQTEEEIVVPRQEQTGEEEDAADMQEGQEPGSAELQGAIAEQVQAPEHYIWEGGSDKVQVKADAYPVIPQGEGFQSWQVTSRVFTQEDYDNVSRVLIKGAQLFARDEDAMAGSNGFTRGEIEERIDRLEMQKEKAGSGSAKVPAKEETYDEVILNWEEMKEQAPEEPVNIEVPAIVNYVKSEEYLEENELFGTAAVEGKNYTVMLNNNLQDNWRWISFEVRNEEARSNFIRAGESASKLPEDAIRKKAQDAAKAMGFSDFEVGGEEYYGSFSMDEADPDSEIQMDQLGYGIIFTRTLEGIPVTYTHEEGTTLEGDEDIPWPYEQMYMVYDKEEDLETFMWSNPCQVEKTSDEYVFLLPFPEIETIFQEMIVKKYEDFFESSEDVKVSFDIHEIRLGYMRVRENGNALEGKMIPVWDFMGDETITYPGEAEPYKISGPYESWLTINAMDGTIIDRGLGR